MASFKQFNIINNKNKLDIVKKVFSTYTKNVDPLFNAIEWVEADILDIPSLNSAFEGVVHVYHCAALVSFEPNKYALLRKTNIEGTANVVNLCLSHSVKKLCYVSSVATLGDSPKATDMRADRISSAIDSINAMRHSDLDVK